MSLTDIIDRFDELYGPSYPICLGNLKIGGLGESRPTRGGGTFRLPRKDDHFTVTTLERDDAGNLIVDETVMGELAQYADDDGKVRQIPIRVLSDDPSDFLHPRLVWYGKRKACAISNGTEVTWFVNRDNPGWLDTPIVEPWDNSMFDLQYDGRPMFKLHFLFDCVIATGDQRWGGFYRFRSTSVISLRRLNESLRVILSLTNGILLGMPLWLVLKQQKVELEKTTSTVYVTHLELRGADPQAMASEQARYRCQFKDQLQRLGKAYQAIKTAPGFENEDEIRELNAEFNSPSGEPSEARWRAIRSQYQQNLPSDCSDVKAAWSTWATSVCPGADPFFKPDDWKSWEPCDFVAAEESLRVEAPRPL